MDILLAASAGLLLGAVVGLIVGRRVAHRDTPSESVDVVPESVLAAALDALIAGAVILDGADDVVFVNQAASAMGIDRRGRVVLPELVELVRDVRRSGPMSAEVTLADGRSVLAQAAAASGTGYVVLLVEDVTDSRRLDAVRRDFVANVSHELKTPVGALALLAEAIHAGDSDAATTRRFAARMQHEANRLGRLVQELIDLSRLQGAEPARPSSDVAVRLVVCEAIDRHRLAATAKSIEVVSGGKLDLVVRGDELQLVTALGNLLDNAIAYSPEGTRVSVGVRRRDDEVEFSVRDEGIGISPDDSERIFERFYRADPARSRETGGTGLGLAIVKHIATNHGGRVSVWSTEGLGSTFTLHLPATSPSPASPAPAAAGRKV